MRKEAKLHHAEAMTAGFVLDIVPPEQLPQAVLAPLAVTQLEGALLFQVAGWTRNSK
jgi:hypothetical protein